ncbi:hypothetical protein LY78DRAFT_187747 [Colletotrichum sublineola]|nr:hypothetical protein LY78DRAFT_187747 [Colletotrichum sublineola]
MSENTMCITISYVARGNATLLAPQPFHPPPPPPSQEVEDSVKKGRSGTQRPLDGGGPSSGRTGTTTAPAHHVPWTRTRSLNLSPSVSQARAPRVSFDCTPSHLLLPASPTQSSTADCRIAFPAPVVLRDLRVESLPGLRVRRHHQFHGSLLALGASQPKLAS